MELKVGDRVKGVYFCSGDKRVEGYFGTVIKISSCLASISRDDAPHAGWVVCQKGDGTWGANVDEGILTIINNKTSMTTILEFVKNLSLSEDERLLRKHGLKDDCGNYTAEAYDLVEEKLTKENETYLIEIAKKKEEEDKNK
jgi:hypothetical protein